MSNSIFSINSKNTALTNHIGFNKSYIIRFSIIAALGGLLFGYDTAVISGAIPFIKVYFNLNENLLGWAVGCILIGCALGAIIAGKIAELKGRKFALGLCAILFAVTGIGAGLATTLAGFVFFRILGGVAVGIASVVSPLYITETSPSSLRGTLVSLYQLAVVTGILLAYVSNYALADIGESNWRWMFASQTFVALLFLLFLLTVPETPRWLIKKTRLSEGLSILKKTGGEQYAAKELSTIQHSFRENQHLKLFELFSAKYSPVLWVGILLAIFQQITGINAVIYYAPTIFSETGVGTSGSLYQTIGIGIVNVAFTFIAIAFVDKIGRKLFLLAGSFMMCISLIVIAFCFMYGYFNNYIILIFTLLYVASFCATLGAVVWVYIAEIFPNKIRGLAMSVATFALWFADFVVTYTFPIMIENFSTATTLFIYAFFCSITFFYVLFKIPETKGKSLEQIEAIVF